MHIIQSVVSNVNGNTVEEISEKIGAKSKYVKHILSILLDLGVLDMKYGKYYIHEEMRYFYELVIDKMIWSLEMPEGLFCFKLGN
jgi:transcription initiation factor IIE alpha subunit